MLLDAEAMLLEIEAMLLALGGDASVFLWMKGEKKVFFAKYLTKVTKWALSPVFMRLADSDLSPRQVT